MMHELFNKLRAQWRGLKTREQLLLAGLAVVVVIMGGQLAWQAYQTHKLALLGQVEQAQSDLLWLEDVRLQIYQLRSQGVNNLGESELVNLIETSAKTIGIEVEMDPVRQDAGPVVDIRLQGSKLSTMLDYLSNLNHSGAELRAVTINRNGNGLSALASIGG